MSPPPLQQSLPQTIIRKQKEQTLLYHKVFGSCERLRVQAIFQGRPREL